MKTFYKIRRVGMSYFYDASQTCFSECGTEFVKMTRAIQAWDADDRVNKEYPVEMVEFEVVERKTIPIPAKPMP